MTTTKQSCASERITLRQWRALRFRNARADLVALGQLQSRLQKQGFSPTVNDLRTRQLRQFLEFRQAALFSYIVGQALNLSIEYALYEQADYDCVLRVEGHKYQAVQLKEIPPQRLNPKATLTDQLSKLAKYVTSELTIVAVNLNQSGIFPDFSAIPKPTISCAQVWLYGSLSVDQSKWFLVGDLLARAAVYEVEYPT